eukprot:166093_1
MYPADEHYSTKIQILDKIHCYFQHCYDLGNRLSSMEKCSVSNFGNQCDQLPEQYLVNEKFKLIHKILSSKRRKHFSIMAKLNERICKKYNFAFDTPRNSTNKLYHFGMEFTYSMTYYGYKANVSPTYSSLKEELTANKISSIGVAQYYIEYNKALVHLNSDYCKKK